MARGNPTPVQSVCFEESQYQAEDSDVYEYPLSKKDTAVKLPEDLDAVLRAMPSKKKAAWIRRTLYNAAREQGMLARKEQ